jgi:cytochrome c oxidase cbb3-type subunit 2
MPAFPWLQYRLVDSATMPSHMRGLRAVGVPYSDAEIGDAVKDTLGKTEEDALIAYLQVLGTALKTGR